VGDCVAAILGVWMTLAPWYGDRHDTPEAREALYRPVAVAICQATDDPGERAFAAAQAYHETRLARAVLEWRCGDMPEGMQCDEGTSAGPLQTKRHATKACRDVWRPQLSDVARYEAGVRCALRGWRWGLGRWGTPAGGFQAQGGISGVIKPWARRRVPLWHRMLGVLR
jgi:hypothetical protein